MAIAKGQPLIEIPNRDPSLLAPQFWEMCQAAMAQIKEELGWDVELFEGFRTNERQQWLWDSSRSRPGIWLTNAKPGQSAHEYHIGADLVAKIKGRWSWDTKQVPYDKFIEIYRSHGLRSLAPKEGAHVEYTAPFRTVELADYVRIHGMNALLERIFTR